jgi:inner membrane protein involved in colicin E2 resistance
MFIVFTFMAFFIPEVIHQLPVHPVQYLLIGLAMIVFYALLLSFSEQVPFGMAYLVSASATIGLIAGYTRAILKNRPVALMVGGILAMLYTYMYILLQLEDHALLMGSIGLFGVLATVMYLTRRIDWYAARPGPQKMDRAQARHQPAAACMLPRCWRPDWKTTSSSIRPIPTSPLKAGMLLLRSSYSSVRYSWGCNPGF